MAAGTFDDQTEIAGTAQRHAAAGTEQNHQQAGQQGVRDRFH